MKKYDYPIYFDTNHQRQKVTVEDLKKLGEWEKTKHIVSTVTRACDMIGDDTTQDRFLKEYHLQPGVWELDCNHLTICPCCMYHIQIPIDEFTPEKIKDFKCFDNCLNVGNLV